MYGLAKLANERLKLFHLSEKDLNGQILTPRIPNNYLTEQGYEENKTPRVSFARSIDGALIGIGQNLKDKEFFIHEPINYSKINHQPATSQDVPDAHLTEEEWVTTPVTLKHVGTIKVGEADEEPLIYHYGKNKAETYRWNWKHLNKKDGE